MNGVANKLLLLTLIAQQHIVIGEPLNTFQLYNFEHTHINIGYPIHCHKFLYLNRHGRVIFIYFNAYATVLYAYKVRRPLIHSCYESETRLIYGAAGRAELWIHQVELMPVGCDYPAWLIQAASNIVVVGIHNPRLGGDEAVLGVSGDTPGWFINRCRTAHAISHVDKLRIDKSELVFGGYGGRRVVYIMTTAIAVE